MQIHSLALDDFSDNDYTLIGMHTTLEEFKLAYFLNLELNTRFVKASYSLDFENRKNDALFSVYEYLNTEFNRNWFLIANHYDSKSEPIRTGLFSISNITTYLISEKKKIDFFLKLEGDFDDRFIANTLVNINKISQVITSYKINPNTLKSKEFLIF